MLPTFGLLLDLLDIPFSSDYMSLGQKLIDTPDKKILSFFSYGFVFVAFQRLLRKEITQEEFIAFGDGSFPLHSYQRLSSLGISSSLLFGIFHDPDAYRNTFILVDVGYKTDFDKMDALFFDQVRSLGSQIVFL